MVKSKRHIKILEIIREKNIDTQEDLAEELKKAGFDVTQATVSRDIKNLRLVKVQGDNGKYRYEAPENKTIDLSEKLTSILTNLTISVENVDKMVIVKTVSAGAAPVAEAIDSFDFPNIAGTIAGENTIFIMVRTIEAAEQLVIDIRKLIS